MSRVRQNFHEDSEALINKQINMEMYASYVYLAMVGEHNFYSKNHLVASLGNSDLDKLGPVSSVPV